MTRKPRASYPNNTRTIAPVGPEKLRRQAEVYREKADELEAMLADAQDHFTEAFASADAQMSTRDRITKAARGKRRLGAVGNR